MAPSTSRANTIPLEFANRLKAKYGGEIVDDAISMKSGVESKSKNYLDKILENPHFVLDRDLSAFAGKNIVIVDDIFSSGGTAKRMSDLLDSHGIKSNDVATIRASDVRFGSVRDLERLATKLADKYDRYFLGLVSRLVEDSSSNYDGEKYSITMKNELQHMNKESNHRAAMRNGGRRTSIPCTARYASGNTAMRMKRKS